MNCTECTITREQNFKGSTIARTRTLGPRDKQQQISVTACTASPRAPKSTLPSRVKLFTARPPPTQDELLSTTARTRTPTVLPVLQHSHSRTIAQGCTVAAQSPSNARNCTRHNQSGLYINCSLAGDTMSTLANRFKCDSLPAVRDFGELVIARYEDLVFGSRPVVKYSRVSDVNFSPCATSSGQPACGSAVLPAPEPAAEVLVPTPADETQPETP